MKYKITWEDWVFVAILFALIIVQLGWIAPLKSLPSPIYGGDYYYHLGYVRHLMDGGSIFQNSQLLDESPWAPFLYQGLLAIFSKVTSIDPMTLMVNCTVLFSLISCILLYWLGNKFFENKIGGLVLSSMYLYIYPIYKYTELAVAITVPLFFIAMYFAWKNNDWKSYIFAGLSYGLIGIAHTMVFVNATIFIAVLFGYTIIKSIIKKEKSYLISIMPKIIVMILIGVVIAQLYWFYPIFKFHLNSPNTISDYDNWDIGTEGMFKNVIRAAKTSFFRMDNIRDYLPMFSVLIFIGMLLFSKNRHPRYQYILIIFVAFVLARFSYIPTYIIMGKDFFSSMVPTTYMYMFQALCVAGLFIFLFEKLNNKLKIVATIALILLLSYTALVAKNDAVQADRFYQSGKNPLPEYMSQVTEWSKNIGSRDVTISTNEISFMFNALTGKKVLNSRRAHSGMWVDVDKRWADSAVILYGNNTQTRDELIKKYNIKYLYWQYDWIDMDFRNDNGNIQLFDPLLIRDINGYDKYLSDNGVNYTRIKTWLDPANKQPGVKQYDALLVYPSYWNATSPWHDSLTKRLIPVKQFYYYGQAVAIIYEIGDIVE